MAVNPLSNPVSGEGIAKASLKWARSRFGGKGLADDPKPGELAMTRVSPTEMWEEARTRRLCNILG